MIIETKGGFSRPAGPPFLVSANSPLDFLLRESGIAITKDINATGNGALAVNVLQLTGSVIVREQWGLITGITTLTNLTNVYASLWDGTNSVNLTADGVTLSGAPVGSLFSKDQINSQPYSVSIADQCRLLETLNNPKVGRPFIITQKNGVDTFIRFHFTTTDNPVDFDLHIYFEYLPLAGGSLVFL